MLGLWTYEAVKQRRRLGPCYASWVACLTVELLVKGNHKRMSVPMRLKAVFLQKGFPGASHRLLDISYHK